MPTIATANPVTINLHDLPSISDNQLEDAFGPDSLGIIVISGLPSEYKILRQKVLQSASKLAALPAAELAKLEDPEAFWLVGWSIGKEKLSSGEPDYTKGSYYVNCNFCRDESKEEPDEATIVEYPDLKEYTRSNKWPSDELIPGFQLNLKSLIRIMVQTTQAVAAACDRYMERNHLASKPGYLQKIVANSDTSKARLLHYLESERAPKGSEGANWCGEHLDHSCLTALTSNYYMDAKDESMKEVTVPKNAQFGLFIRDRHDNLVKVDIPGDALAFQTGSALQELTNGKFKAVSHMVVGPQGYPNLSRNTLAVFCQPSLSEKVNESQDFANYARMILQKNHN